MSSIRPSAEVLAIVHERTQARLRQEGTSSASLLKNGDGTASATALAGHLMGTRKKADTQEEVKSPKQAFARHLRRVFVQQWGVAIEKSTALDGLVDEVLAQMEMDSELKMSIEEIGRKIIGV